MKILHLNTVVNVKSTGKIVYLIHSKLIENNHESMICYGRWRAADSDKSLIKISSNLEFFIHALLARITGMQGVFSFFSTWKLKKTIKKFNPDIVHLYNLHGYYVNEFGLFRFLKANNISTVYSMLDEYPYMGKCTYSMNCDKFMKKCYNCPEVKEYPKSFFFDFSTKIFNLKQNAYKDFEKIIFTGPEWVKERASASMLLKNKNIELMDEPIDTNFFFYPRNTELLIKKINIAKEKVVVLTVATYEIKRKGGDYFIEVAKQLENSNILFVFVGYNGDTKLLPANILPISYVKDQHELATYYSMADLFVCTSYADTMPNVCLEALACGTSICGFNISGIPYTADAKTGFFVPFPNTKFLAEYISKTKKKTPEDILKCREYAVKRYSIDSVYIKLIDIYSNLLRRV